MAYNLPNVQPPVVAAANEIGGKFGLKTIGGWRKYDQFPDHPNGLALDLMINNMPNGHALGDQIAQYLIDNAKRLNLKYLIWNRRTWNTERGTWKPYTSTDNPHTDHVHATFTGKAVSPGLPSAPGTVTGPGLPGDLIGAVGAAADALKSMATGVNAVGNLAQKAMWLALPTSQVRIVSGIAGAVLVFYGIFLLGKQAKNG